MASRLAECLHEQQACENAGGHCIQDIEALLATVGCAVTQGAGSRVRFDFTFAPDTLGQARNLAFLCHRPHRGKEAKRYKGYSARIEFDARDDIFVGHLLGIDDRVSFHADTVAGLKAAFEEAVNHYLLSCQQTGRTPQSAASGRLMLRIAPQVHRASLLAAQAAGKA